MYIKGSLYGLKKCFALIRLLDWLAKKELVKGVVLLIDSPGGSWAYVKALARGLEKLRQTKIMLAFTQKDCCSGGYLIASYCHKIVAQETAVIGSIGVVLERTSDYSMTKQQLGTSVKETYNDFVTTVAKNRCEDPTTLASYKSKLIKTQARTFPAITAKEKGLIDCIGDLHFAIAIVQEVIKRTTVGSQACEVFYHEPATVG